MCVCLVLHIHRFLFTKRTRVDHRKLGNDKKIRIAHRPISIIFFSIFACLYVILS